MSEGNPILVMAWRPIGILFGIAVLLLCCLTQPAMAQDLPSITEKTASLERRDGFIPIYYDEEDGKLYLEVALPSVEFLYLGNLASGAHWVLQRGGASWAVSGALVRFQRHGPKLLLVRENTRYTTQERENVGLEAILDASVPQSVMGAFPIVAEEEGRVLIDGTAFFLRDVHGVPQRLTRYEGQGFRLDRERSMIYEPGCKAFPRNTEIESLLSFTSDRPGRWANSNFPDRGTVTVRQRHSLIALPPDGYRPRAHDPRTGLFFDRSTDLSARVEDGYERRMVGGWRLEKKDPGAPLSEPVRPITVYMEAAIPEEYRDAVRDGILYWNRAFRAAGFVNAVRAEVLPPEADPLDVRYPIVVFWSPIRWVAAGQSVSDPRTGEYIKGWVFLTGYKALADLNTYLAIRPALAERQLSADEFMMARMSWVTAHELGHALIGLYHNDFVLTQIGFPTPLLTVTDDGGIAIDVTPAFPDDPYPYDEWMVRYAYTPFESEAAEAEGLAMIAEEGLRQGLRYVDDYARRSNPRASGRRHNDDVLADLEREVAVRRVLLDHFGPDVLRPGESMSVLFERLIPVYFRHQYALAAVGKAIGGVDYSYALAGDGQVPVRVIDADEQRQAIARLLDALAPEELAIPDGIAELIPPRPRSLRTSEYEWPLSQGGEFEFITGESAPIVIPLSAGGVFDPLDWARSLSSIVVRELLSRQRAARVAALNASGLSDLTLIELMERVVDGTWGARLPNDPGLAALGRVARRSVLDRLIAVANDEGTVAEVREAAAWALTQLREDLLERRPDDPAERAHVILALRDLEAFAEPE